MTFPITEAAFLLLLQALPPAAYDHEPKRYTLVRVPFGDMETVCKFPYPELRLIGCTDGPLLHVFIRDDVHGLEFEGVLRHEWAHLNGWSHD
ncbi:MAG: hypothetical protein WC829_06940 [Hyphomicrobium sp.]|jgi:hypothetical protein